MISGSLRVILCLCLILVEYLMNYQKTNNITLHPEYAEFSGYIEEEVIEYMKGHLEVFCKKTNLKALMSV